MALSVRASERARAQERAGEGGLCGVFQDFFFLDGGEVFRGV